MLHSVIHSQMGPQIDEKLSRQPDERRPNKWALYLTTGRLHPLRTEKVKVLYQKKIEGKIKTTPNGTRLSTWPKTSHSPRIITWSMSIELSHTACRDEYRRNPRSHRTASWCFLSSLLQSFVSRISKINWWRVFFAQLLCLPRFYVPCEN